jgi:hypothetical protein
LTVRTLTTDKCYSSDTIRRGKRFNSVERAKNCYAMHTFPNLLSIKRYTHFKLRSVKKSIVRKTWTSEPQIFVETSSLIFNVGSELKEIYCSLISSNQRLSAVWNQTGLLKVDYWLHFVRTVHDRLE